MTEQLTQEQIDRLRDLDKAALVGFIHRVSSMMHEYDVEYVEEQVKAFFAQFPHLEDADDG